MTSSFTGSGVLPSLTEEQQESLKKVVAKLCAEGKGLLVADETDASCSNRFNKVQLTNNEYNRRMFRQLLYDTGVQMSSCISGIIMRDESFEQKSEKGVPFPNLILSNGMLPGIRMDQDIVRLAASQSEFCTEGLDKVSSRCLEYRLLGARFAKWRCVFKIAENAPTLHAILDNASSISRFVVMCQQNNLVPLIETKISSEGFHSLEHTQLVYETVLSYVFRTLFDHRAYLEGMLLQVNMVLPGDQCFSKYSAQQICQATLQALSRTVPAALKGIFFVSGEQTSIAMLNYLNGINEIPFPKPWRLTFSFGRAIQIPVLAKWRGDTNNAYDARKELMKIIQWCNLASLGKLSSAALQEAIIKFQAYHSL